MDNRKMYHGSCHCKEIEYEVTADIKELVSCNCSICYKKGWLILGVNTASGDSMKILKGKEVMTEYTFSSGKAHHCTCSKCGVNVFLWVKDEKHPSDLYYSVNARCLDDLDISQFEIRHFDGKSMNL